MYFILGSFAELYENLSYLENIESDKKIKIPAVVLFDNFVFHLLSCICPFCMNTVQSSFFTLAYYKA